MKDARWQEVSHLYFKALELPENERDAFLRTCEDEELRQEVLSLLANETRHKPSRTSSFGDDSWV